MICYICRLQWHECLFEKVLINNELSYNKFKIQYDEKKNYIFDCGGVYAADNDGNHRGNVGANER